MQVATHPRSKSAPVDRVSQRPRGRRRSDQSRVSGPHSARLRIHRRCEWSGIYPGRAILPAPVPGYEAAPERRCIAAATDIHASGVRQGTRRGRRCKRDRIGSRASWTASENLPGEPARIASDRRIPWHRVAQSELGQPGHSAFQVANSRASPITQILGWAKMRLTKA